MPPRKTRSDKSTAPSPAPVSAQMAAEQEPEQQEENTRDQSVEEDGGDSEIGSSAMEDIKGKGKMSMSDRFAKMKDLRSRMVRLHPYVLKCPVHTPFPDNENKVLTYRTNLLSKIEKS